MQPRNPSRSPTLEIRSFDYELGNGLHMQQVVTCIRLLGCGGEMWCILTLFGLQSDNKVLYGCGEMAEREKNRARLSRAPYQIEAIVANATREDSKGMLVCPLCKPREGGEKHRVLGLHMLSALLALL
ncbi:hypothetical protein PG994_003182 [Apiospora phragmitis]|uniref:Uncharacterized protein n=1 Tax=Apiospora phragmitis TaxID=2905665 RepID=A0ABR1VXD6_9PEZI